MHFFLNIISSSLSIGVTVDQLEFFCWLVWLWWVIPNHTVVEHVVALIVENSTIVCESEEKPSREGASIANPTPNDVEGKHLVPSDEVGITLHSWGGDIVMVMVRDGWRLLQGFVVLSQSVREIGDH